MEDERFPLSFSPTLALHEVRTWDDSYYVAADLRSWVHGEEIWLCATVGGSRDRLLLCACHEYPMAIFGSLAY